MANFYLLNLSWWLETNVVLVDVLMIEKAESSIASCEACRPDTAELSFDSVIDDLTGHDPEFTEYIMAEAARCPRCGRAVVENTLVALREK
jgi:hypothetical protein